MKILLAIVMVVMLSSCATVGAGLQAGAEKAKQAADITAEAATRDDCAITYGAYLRLPANKRLGVRLICDPAALEKFITTQ